MEVGRENCVQACQHHHHQASKFDRCMKLIEKICAIALGVFSAHVSLQLFVPYFFAGMAVGVYLYVTDKKPDGEKKSLSACASGVLEQYTGIRLPEPITLAINMAIMICHIDHHATVFVPIMGVSLGAWAGKNALHYGNVLYQRLAIFQPKSSHYTMA